VLLNTALRETVEERDEAMRRMEQVLRTREEFLASAAHDLKNPLAGIKGNVQLLERRARSSRLPEPEQLADALHRIDVTVTRAAADVEELLDFARLQIGEGLERNRAPLDLVALVRDVVAEQSQRSSKHDVRAHATASAIVGDWDARRLSRVIGNLIDNALRYIQRARSRSSCASTAPFRRQGVRQQ
jgi:signal transduction histidine kinase